MNEIICPNCTKNFKIEDAGFADILKQVRDNQFEEELNKRLSIADEQKQSAIQLAIEKTKNSLNEVLSNKDNEITILKANSKSQLIEKLAEKNTELSDMKSKIENFDTVKELAVSKAKRKLKSNGTLWKMI